MNRKNLLIIVSLIFITYYQSFSQNSFLIKFSDAGKNRPEILSAFNRIEPVFDKEVLKTGKNKDRILSPAQNQLIENLSDWYVVSISDIDLINRLKSEGKISVSTPNYIYHIEKTKVNDERSDEQWGTRSVNAEKAWEKASGKDILVGVVDTGIDYQHPDLIKNISINVKEDINHNGTFEPWPADETKNGITGDLNGIDEDQDGFADDVIGYDFVDQFVMNIGDASRPDPIPADEHGHGTVVSGIIAAEQNNKIGISGIAYNSKIVAIRAFDVTGNGETDDIARAILYAAFRGIKVLNFSFGEPDYSPLIHDAIKLAASMGCFMAASSGNNGWDLKHYPSDFEEVMSVGGINENENRYYRSNYGSRISLSAPGVKVLTTDTYGRYSFNSGTSMSAPYVSAAAAMLIELYPDIKPEEISAKLMATARDISYPGWDIFTGSGILDINASLEFGNESVFGITSPANEENINKEDQDELIVSGNVLTPLFEKYELYIGEGSNRKVSTLEKEQDDWTLINESDEQVNDGTLGTISGIGELKDTVYTIRLKIYLKNNSTIEKRNVINISSSSSPLRITGIDVTYPFFNNKRIVMISAITNRESDFYVEFRKAGSNDEYNRIYEIYYNSNYHTVLVDNEAAADVQMTGNAIAFNPNGDTAQKKIIFSRPSEAFPKDKFIRKKYSFPASYLHDKVIETDNEKLVAVNDFSSGGWGGVKIYKYEDSSFSERYSSENVWLPVGSDDTDGDGKKEILYLNGGKTILAELDEQSDDPLSNIIFADTSVGAFWASELTDIDKDGLDDIIAFNDTSVFVYSYKNGKYILNGLGTSDLPYKFIGTFPGIAVGDFDNDGKMEICHGSEYGNVYIYEYNNGKLTREFIDPDRMTTGGQFLCPADVDGDGIPEILIGQYGTNTKLTGNVGGTPLWRVRLLKWNGTEYKYIWTDYIFGVRAGISYRNGFNAANIDDEAGDEILISTFPNFYVLKWDRDKNMMIPFWTYDASFSNTALAYDFDGNGINEFCFTGIFPGENGYKFKTAFFEYDKSGKGPSSPPNFNGYSVNSMSAKLKWYPSPEAEYYRIYKLEEIDNVLYGSLIDSTTENEMTINGLDNNTIYYFAATTVNTTMADIESGLSDVANVFTHDPYEAITAEQNDCSSLKIPYTGKLLFENVNQSDFKLISLPDSIEYIPSTVLLNSDSIIVLNFNEKLSGDFIFNSVSFPDYYGSPTKEKEINFTAECPDQDEKIILLKLDVISYSQLQLEYSEEVNITEAENSNNYTIKPYGEILNIKKAEGKNNTVDIFLDGSFGIGPLGRNYTLTVENVHSTDGISITDGPGNTLGFVFSGKNGESAFIYPHPVNFKKYDNFMIANLPPKAEIYILTTDGELLNTLYERDGNGGTEWDGTDKEGNPLKSGVYLLKVAKINTDGSKSISGFRKFVVIN